MRRAGVQGPTREVNLRPEVGGVHSKPQEERRGQREITELKVREGIKGRRECTQDSLWLLVKLAARPRATR